MADRLDVLRSFLRSAADAGSRGLAKVTSWDRVRKLVDELRARRTRLPEAQLSAAMARAPGVTDSTVQVVEGRLAVVNGYDDGATVAFTVVPEQTRFAPRGAKEVIFRVEPAEMVGDPRVRESVGVLAAAVAFLLWGPALGLRRGHQSVLVEREGVRLRADLRELPAVRDALEGGPLAPVLDSLRVDRFELGERALSVVVALPFPGAP